MRKRIVVQKTRQMLRKKKKSNEKHIKSTPSCTFAVGELSETAEWRHTGRVRAAD